MKYADANPPRARPSPIQLVGQARTEFSTIVATLSLVFSASVGFGVVTPVLPAALMHMRTGLSAEELAWHTGLLTGIYTFMGFGLARLWGQLSDRVGRKPVLLAAAGGHAVMLIVFPFIPGLGFAYLGRAAAGIFAAAIVPVGLAWLSDFSPQPLRARRFATLSIASLLGFLVGPVIGAALGGDLGTRWLQQVGLHPGTVALPFFAAGAIGAAAWLVCLLAPAWRAPAALEDEQVDAATAGPLPNLVVLITMSGAVAFALGAFEVGLTLLSTQALQLSQAKLAAMFVECSMVMIVAQVLISAGVFDRLPPRAVLAAGTVILALGFGLLPFTGAGVAMTLSIAAVAASAGILLPLLSYWTSLQSVHARGAALGTQSSFASLGQALGSSSAGGLFALTPVAPFWAGALTVATSWLAVSVLASPRSDRNLD